MTPTQQQGRTTGQADTAAIAAWFAKLRPYASLKGSQRAQAAFLMREEAFAPWLAAEHPEALAAASGRLLAPSPDELTRCAALSLAGVESLALLDYDPGARARFARRVASPYRAALGDAQV